MDPLSMVGIAGGLIQGIGGLFGAGKQRKMAKEAARRSQQMFDQSVGYANQNLDLSKQGLAEARLQAGGRMAGAAAQEQNIYGNQANTLANIGRNATDASQALALAGATQGQTNAAFNNLALNEGQNKIVQQQNVNQARSGVQQAQNQLGDIYMHQSDMAAQAATGLGQAAQQNTFGALGAIGNTAMMAGMGAFGNPFGGGGGAVLSQGRTMGIGGGMTYPGMMPAINYNIPYNSIVH